MEALAVPITATLRIVGNMSPMNATWTMGGPTGNAGVTGNDQGRVPTALKWAYTAFMAVLVPVYWSQYGPTNFLYFCDVALFLTLAGMWLENRLLVSMAAVGILLPQGLWCADFVVQSMGGRLTGMTAYMFDASRPLLLRGLSLFHGWLPFLLLFLVRRLGYDGRALRGWTATAWALCMVSYFLLPPAGAEHAGKLVPNNVNYVWGFDDAKPQDWMPSGWYLAAWMAGLACVVYAPTHWVLQRLGAGGGKRR
jgi:hypothetical protein